MRLECPYCPGEDYHHLVTTIVFTDDDNYKMVTMKVGDHVFNVSGLGIGYNYRSQDNIHLLFVSECCRKYHMKSFDGHKGVMFMDENPFVHGLVRFINDKSLKIKNSGEWALTDLQLLAAVEELIAHQSQTETEISAWDD